MPRITPYGVSILSEKKRIITIEAVYDNSDLITDYFDNNARLREWYVEDFNGKIVTESKLRKSISKLPKWLQDQTWTFQKGEKYSMSDHPYGQLECTTNLVTENGISHTVAVRFIVTLGWLDLFQMNNSIDKLPELADVEKFLEVRKKVREQRLENERIRHRIEEGIALEITNLQSPCDDCSYLVWYEGKSYCDYGKQCEQTAKPDRPSLKDEYQELYRNNRMADRMLDIEELVGEAEIMEWQDEVDQAMAQKPPTPTPMEQALHHKNQKTLLAYT